MPIFKRIYIKSAKVSLFLSLGWFAIHRMGIKPHKEKTASHLQRHGFHSFNSPMIPTGLEPATSTLSR